MAQTGLSHSLPDWLPYGVLVLSLFLGVHEKSVHTWCLNIIFLGMLILIVLLDLEEYQPMRRYCYLCIVM